MKLSSEKKIYDIISVTWVPTTKVWVWNIKNQIITKAWLDLSTIPLWNDFFVWWSVSKSSDINWDETEFTWNIIYKF